MSIQAHTYLAITVLMITILGTIGYVLGVYINDKREK
tara:strand:+ start:1726 stop:1836 length:111 start_codon:yes stop_codon:yes gene_type:complete